MGRLLTDRHLKIGFTMIAAGVLVQIGIVVGLVAGWWR